MFDSFLLAGRLAADWLRFTNSICDLRYEIREQLFTTLELLVYDLLTRLHNSRLRGQVLLFLLLLPWSRGSV